MEKTVHKIAGAVLLALALLPTGCMVVAVPLPRHVPFEFGTRGRIRAEELAFLKEGSTTKEEVVLRLGEPDHVFKNGKEFIYQWRSYEGGWAVGPAEGPPVKEGNFGDRLTIIRIRFDEEGVFISLSRSFQKM